VINQNFIEKSSTGTDADAKAIQSLNFSSKITPKPQINMCPPFYRCLNGGYCIVDETSGPKCNCVGEYEGVNCGQSKKLNISA
jgi:hypothetical protein